MSGTTPGGGGTPVTDIAVATTEDLERLTDMWVALVEGQRHHGTHIRGEPNRQNARDVLGRYIAVDDLLVARAAGDIVGFAMVHVETGLYQQDATRGIVDNVFVEPDTRDAGIGSLLLDAAETHLEDAGADVISLSVLAENEGARRLYERSGYVPHRIELEKQLGSDTDTNEDGEG